MSTYERVRQVACVGCVGVILGFVVSCGGGGDPAAAPPAPAPIVSPPPAAGFQVMGSAPSNAEEEPVPPNQRIAVQFNAPIDVSSVNQNTIRLETAEGMPVDASLEVDQTNHIVIVSPTVELNFNSQYRLQVTSGCRSAAGISLAQDTAIEFHTGSAPSAAPPSVASASPNDGSVDISTQEALQIQFGPEAIDASSVNETNIKLRKSDGSLVKAKIEFNLETNVALVTPEGSLEVSTSYQLEISGIRTLTNVELSSSVEIHFTTTAEPEPAAPPKVSGSTPAAGAVDVAVESALSIQFDQAMDVATLTAANVQLKRPDGSAVEATLSFDAETKVLLITPQASLEAGTTYHLELSTAVQSALHVALEQSISIEFTTAAAPEPAAPKVESTTPAHGSIDVASNASLQIQFDQAMDVSTLTSANIQLTAADGSLVAANITFDAASHVAILTPQAELTADATYHLEISTGVESSADVALESAVSIEFHTSAAPSPPAVTSTVPANGAVDVAIDAALGVQFDRAMDAATLTAEHCTLKKLADGAAVALALTYHDALHHLALVPQAALELNTAYRLEIGTGVKGADGMALAAAVIVDFTTAAPSESESGE